MKIAPTREIAAGFAMMLGGARTLGEVDARTWTAFAAESGLGTAYVRRRAREIADMMADRALQVAETIADLGFEREELRRLAELVSARAEQVVASLMAPKT